MPAVENILFITAYLLVPGCAFLMLKAAKVDPFSVSVPAVFFAYYLAFSYLGVMPLYFGWDPYCVLLGVTERSTILELFFFSASCLLLITVGILLGSKMLPAADSAEQLGCALNRRQFGVCILLLLFSVGVLVLYTRELSSIPIFSLLRGDTSSLFQMRSQATNAFEGKVYRYAIVLDTVLPFLTFLLFSHAMARRSLVSKVAFVAVFSVAFFAAIIAVMKGKAAWLVMGVFLSYLLSRGKKFNMKIALYLVATMVALLTPMYVYFMGMYGRGMGDVLTSLFSRILTRQMMPSYFYLAMFPDHTDYLMGRSLPNPGQLLPWQHYKITVEVANYMNPTLADAGIVGSAPTTFWAELYANFGFMFPLLVAPVIGFVLYLIYLLLSRFPHSPVKVALLVWSCLHFMKIAVTGIGTFLIDVHLVAVLLVVTLLFLKIDRLKVPDYARGALD